MNDEERRQATYPRYGTPISAQHRNCLAAWMGKTDAVKYRMGKTKEWGKLVQKSDPVLRKRWKGWTRELTKKSERKVTTEMKGFWSPRNACWSHCRNRSQTPFDKLTELSDLTSSCLLLISPSLVWSNLFCTRSVTEKRICCSLPDQAILH